MVSEDASPASSYSGGGAPILWLAGPVDWLNGLIHGLGGRWLAQQLWTIDGLGGPVDGLIKLVEGLFLFSFYLIS